MADELTPQDLQQLREIATSLPAGHPAQKKVSALLNSQPTQFEKERPGGGTTQGAPLENGGYAAPSDTKGLASSIWEGTKGLASGIAKSLDPTSGLSGAGLAAIGMNPREGGVSARLQEIPAVRAGHEVISALHDPNASASQVALAAPGSLAGVSSEIMRGHAARGESGDIIGEAAVPAAATLIGAGAAKVLPRISSAAGDVADVAGKSPKLSKLILGDRFSTLLSMFKKDPESIAEPQKAPEPDTFAGGTSTAKPVGSAELPKVGAIRLPQVAPPAPKPAAFPGAVSSLRPVGSAELPAPSAARLPQMTAPEPAVKPIAAQTPAEPIQPIGRPAAGAVPSGPSRLPTLFEKSTRPSTPRLPDLVDQAMGVKPLKPDVPLNEQLTKATAGEPAETDPVKIKYPDPAVRQMVRANGERVYEAAKGNPSDVKAIHDLSRVDLRQALINSGEDMGQTTVSNSKFAGEGSITREDAFNRLLDKGHSPQDIVKLAKQEAAPAASYKPSEKAGVMSAPRRSLGPEFEEQQRSHELERNKSILRNPAATEEDKRIAQSRIDEGTLVPENPANTTNFIAKRAARDRAARIREARP